LRATRIDLLSMLKASGAPTDRSRYRIGKALIAVQVALSLILAVGSAMLVRTLINLSSEPIGFQPENLLVFQLNPTLSGYKEERLLNFHEEVVRRLGQIPGVRSASMSRWGILSGAATSDGINTAGQQKNVPVRIHYVSPRFFETVGFPLLAGRDIAWSDRGTSQRVMVINATLARQIFAGQNPVGRTVQMNGNDVEIVGMAGDTKFESLRRAVPATIYIPFRQNAQYSMTYVVRSETEPKALVAVVRRAVESVDPNVPMYEVKTQVEQINEVIRRERLFAALLSGFAVIALVLASMGIYGTLAYLVTRRTPEIAVRLALGAQRADVVGLVLRESIAPVLAGVVVGVAGSFAAGKLVESMLFGLKPQDPLALAAASAILLGSAILAGWWPARRASRIAPMAALRQE
jgi:predicted permease